MYSLIAIGTRTVSEDRREEDDDGMRYVVGEEDGGLAPFSLSLIISGAENPILYIRTPPGEYAVGPIVAVGCAPEQHDVPPHAPARPLPIRGGETAGRDLLVLHESYSATGRTSQDIAFLVTHDYNFHTQHNQPMSHRSPPQSTLEPNSR